MSEQSLSLLIEKSANLPQAPEFIKKLNLELEIGSVLIYFNLSLT